MKYAIKIRSIIWRKISIYSVQGLPVGSNNVGFDVIGASPEECYGYAGVQSGLQRADCCGIHKK